MATDSRRYGRRGKGLPTWRIIRYADDFVVLVHGSRSDVEVLNRPGFLGGSHRRKDGSHASTEEVLA
jgi:hypothetical protein